jgi:hypothetical protein
VRINRIIGGCGMGHMSRRRWTRSDGSADEKKQAQRAERRRATMQTMFLTLAAVCLPLGAVMIASFAGVLLAPLDLSGRRAVLRSQWPTRQTPISVPPCKFGGG